MTTNPHSKDFDVPTSADAVRILAEITPVTRRSRRLARDVTFARPLLAWGLAWAAGASLFQFVPGVGGALLGTAVCAAAVAITWLVRPREVRLHNDRRFALLWLVLFATSPLLVAVAAPANARIMAVFLASLWAVGMLLYGIGVQDLPLAMVGLAIVAVAAIARIAAPQLAMLIVGLAGGLGMAALGGWRMRWRR
ncbi:MAG: hypothetical protein M3Z75_12435 [Actinomycetota bacterium]|nr:hypothetical protein [Actinomycetota bacterium]